MGVEIKEWEIGVCESEDHNECAHYHPHAATESEALEIALRDARREFETPEVVTAKGPFEPMNKPHTDEVEFKRVSDPSDDTLAE